MTAGKILVGGLFVRLSRGIVAFLIKKIENFFKNQSIPPHQGRAGEFEGASPHWKKLELMGSSQLETFWGGEERTTPKKVFNYELSRDFFYMGAFRVLRFPFL